jgi:hypothetical protein
LTERFSFIKLNCSFKQKAMTKYNTFLVLFILSIASLIVFMLFYLQAIFGFAFSVADHEPPGTNAISVLADIFTPGVIVSGGIMALTSLLYRVLGIVRVAKSKTVSDGEKALWIVGFVIMGFITAIVFLVMAKGKQFVD